MHAQQTLMVACREKQLSRREALLLLPLTLGGLATIRSATIGAYPSSLEGPIGRAGAVDMRGKVAVVTGANTGIGFETAQALAAQGALVVLAGRSLEKLADAAERIRAKLPAEAAGGAKAGSACMAL